MAFSKRVTLAQPAVQGGELTGWSVESLNPSITLGSELLPNGDMETGDPPTGWGTYHCSLASEADERTGGAGAACGKITLTDLTGGRMQRGTGASTMAAGDMLELSGWAKAVSEKWTSIQMVDGAFSSYLMDGNYATNAWKQVMGIRRSSATQMYAWGSVSSPTVIGDIAHFDDISIKKITIPDDLGMGGANMQLDLEFTLPVSPVSGQRINLYYRIAGTLGAGAASYCRASITRNLANTAWGLKVHAVNGDTETLLRSVSDVGSPERLRVKCIASEHRFYTYASETWTQQGDAATSTWNATERGANAVWNTGFTVAALRGSRPEPF